MKYLQTNQKNAVLKSMVKILSDESKSIMEANQIDLDNFEDKSDRAMYDRLIVDEKKISEMIQAVEAIEKMDDPVGKTIVSGVLENGLKVENKTAPFGTILIIYESRPDVTIEAAVLAFKANNKILLKGGKEAKNTNKALVGAWHKALKENNLSEDWIKILDLDRTQTQEFLKNPTEAIDLIVPRGGEKLIEFVKENATCAVLISGRGNNFIYLNKDADWEKSFKVINNAKTQKISACNALDKILVDKNTPDLKEKLSVLIANLEGEEVEVLIDENVAKLGFQQEIIVNEAVWYEEFLAMKIAIGLVDDLQEAIAKINKYSGGHSNGIMTEDKELANEFMLGVDSAAVYHNASTRFTDGGQMGVGAELAISTDKLHHRGPLGLEQLVSNKYFVYGDGQIRV